MANPSQPLKTTAQVVPEQPVQKEEVQTPPPVVTSTKPAPVAQTQTELDFEGAHQEYLSGKKGQDAQVFFNSIEDYLKKMAPGIQNTAKQGVYHQYMLWNALNAVLNSTTDVEFKRIWTVFLWKVSNNISPGAFARTHAFRFFEEWDKGKEAETAMHALLDLILQTCNTYKDQSSKSQTGIHYDLNRGLKVGFSEKARARLTSYYSYLVIAKV